jgi:tetratricopeptide (TPR) repeat protein
MRAGETAWRKPTHMATKKKTAAGAAAKKGGSRTESEATRTGQHEAYDKAVEEFGQALELFNRGEFERAGEAFCRIAESNPDEPLLADRARTYGRICERRAAPPPAEPATAEERYYRAVVLANGNRCDEALELLDEALREDPGSARYLYARASAFALKGSVDAAVRDLRQAIAVDPQIRFQATNDPDFESIREEPAFIDVIEPTPAGA